MEADQILKSKIYDLAQKTYQQDRNSVVSELRELLTKFGIYTDYRETPDTFLNKLLKIVTHYNLSDVELETVQAHYYSKATDKILEGK